jgi:hypothetical protein
VNTYAFTPNQVADYQRRSTLRLAVDLLVEGDPEQALAHLLASVERQALFLGLGRISLEGTSC